MSVGPSDTDQQMGRSVIFTGLNLDNVRYQIEVYASTSVGQGLSSIPVFVGMDSGIATEAPPTTTEGPQDMTSSIQLPTTPLTDAPGTTSSEPTTMPRLPMTTDTPATVGETQPASLRNDEYYIIRIVPPVVAGLFIIVIVVAVAMGFCCHSRVNRESKKGLYAFDASKDYALK